MYYVEPRISAFIFCRFVHWKPNGCLFGPALELFPLLYQSFTEHDAARYKILNKRLTSTRAVSRVLCDSHLALVRREAPLLAPPMALVMSSPRNLCFTGRFRGSSCPSQLIEDSPPIHGLASPNSGGSGDRRFERAENHHLAPRAPARGRGPDPARSSSQYRRGSRTPLPRISVTRHCSASDLLLRAKQAAGSG